MTEQLQLGDNPDVVEKPRLSIRETVLSISSANRGESYRIHMTLPDGTRHLHRAGIATYAEALHRAQTIARLCGYRIEEPL